MADRQFDLAVNAAEGLIRDFPEEPELQELLRHAREARDRAGRKDAYSRGCRDFEALMRDGKFEQAVTAAERLIAAYPEEKEPPELLSRARKAREEAERKAAYSRDRQDFEALMRDRKFEQAITAAQQLMTTFPEDPDVPELLRDAQAARELAEMCIRDRRKAELERLLDQGDAESAAALLKTLSARYQRDNLFADLSRRIGRMESEKREQDAVNGIVARSQRLGDGGYWDDARLAIDLGLKQFPKSGALLAQRERILQQAELQTVVNDIQRKIAREEWDSVVNSAESGLRKFPGDPRLTELLRTARGEREWKELLLRTESLILAGDLQEADQTIAELARRGRDNAAVVRLLRMLGDKRQRQQSLASADQFRKLSLIHI